VINTVLTSVRRVPRLWTRLLVIAFLVVLAGCLLHNLAFQRASAREYRVPQNAAMEDRLGVRFSRVVVVGDGGLVTLTYVVLDPEKASRFQSDVSHPPQLKSERRSGTAWRVALMKQGHALRAGQTYYLVYQNPSDLIRPGEKIEIDYGRQQLRHVPVL
jgi:hypothetical protein